VQGATVRARSDRRPQGPLARRGDACGLLARATRRRSGAGRRVPTCSGRGGHARQNRSARFRIHDADRRDRRRRREIDIDHLAGGTLRARHGLCRLGRDRLGSLRPGLLVATEILIEDARAQIGADVACVAEKSERFAILADAPVAHREHMGDKAEPVRLKRMAQGNERRLNARTSAFGVGGHVGQQPQACPNVGGCGRNARRRDKERLLAARFNGVACQRVEACKRRARHEGERAEFLRAHLQRPPLRVAIAPGAGSQQSPSHRRAKDCAENDKAGAQRRTRQRPNERKPVSHEKQSGSAGRDPQTQRRGSDRGIDTEHHITTPIGDEPLFPTKKYGAAACATPVLQPLRSPWRPRRSAPRAKGRALSGRVRAGSLWPRAQTLRRDF
jgi:hypothetical protein